ATRPKAARASPSGSRPCAPTALRDVRRGRAAPASPEGPEASRGPGRSSLGAFATRRTPVHGAGAAGQRPARRPEALARPALGPPRSAGAYLTMRTILSIKLRADDEALRRPAARRSA